MPVTNSNSSYTYEVFPSKSRAELRETTKEDGLYCKDNTTCPKSAIFPVECVVLPGQTFGVINVGLWLRFSFSLVRSRLDFRSYPVHTNQTTRIDETLCSRTRSKLVASQFVNKFFVAFCHVLQVEWRHPVL